MVLPPVNSEADKEERRRWKEQQARERSEALWRSFLHTVGVIIVVLLIVIAIYYYFGSSTPSAPIVARVQTPFVYQSPLRASMTQSAAQTPVPVVVTQSPAQTPVPVVGTQSPVQTPAPVTQSPVTGPWKKCFQ